MIEGASVRLVGVSKRFGATQALDDVSLEIVSGRVHALVGENGAGKSTLGKIIGGVYALDRGVMEIDGSPVGRWDSPTALAAGIATIQQELSLVPELTVAQNVFLGIEQARVGVLTGSIARRFAALEDIVGFGIDPDVRLGSLRLADQQKVEIMRAIAREARLIVMDEPTSSLTRDESDRLHATIDRLRAEGRTIIYVSHFLDEVLTWADTVTVMRDGRHVRTAPTAQETKDSLVEAMLGRTMDATFPPRPPRPVGREVLRLRGVGGAVNADVDVHVSAGEIVGLAGLVGSGRTELARLVFGADRLATGTIELDGRPLGPLTPQRAIAQGIVMVPEDRRRLGLVMSQNVRENATLPWVRRFARYGGLARGEERGETLAAIERLGVVPGDPEGDVAYFSGGNQQKVLFAKWTLDPPRVIVLDEPTRGVDVGAKRRIYEAIVEVAASGAAVVLISSELEEIMALSHRVYLMSGGRVIDAVEPDRVGLDEVLRRLFDTRVEVAQ